VEEDGFDCRGEPRITAAKLVEGACGGFGVDGFGVERGDEAAAGVRQDGQAGSDVEGERVDGADVQAVGVVEDLPVEYAVAGKDSEGERAGCAIEVVGWRSLVLGGEELG